MCQIVLPLGSFGNAFDLDEQSTGGRRGNSLGSGFVTGCGTRQGILSQEPQNRDTPVPAQLECVLQLILLSYAGCFALWRWMKYLWFCCLGI